MGENCIALSICCGGCASLVLMILGLVFMSASTSSLKSMDLMPVRVAKMDWDRKFINDVYTVSADKPC